MSVARRTAPSFISPMQPTNGALPHGDEWLYELKLDGYRCVAVKRGSKVILYSRNGHDLTPRFQTVAEQIERLRCQHVVLDGELVALDKQGRPSFQLLQAPTAKTPLRYFAFDVLQLNGKQLLSMPLVNRKERLAELCHGRLCFSEALDGDAAAVLAAVKEHELEGVVAKRRDSRYLPGKRTAAWIKHRVGCSQEFVVGGYLAGRTIEALVVGYYEGRKFHYAGKVRGGLTWLVRAQLDARLGDPVDCCPFVSIPLSKDISWGEGMTNEELARCIWLKPALVVQCKYASWEKAGLRHAHFVGVRDDKHHREVTRAA